MTQTYNNHLFFSSHLQDDEGRTGPFLDEVRKWHKQERMTFVDEIKEKLGDTK